MNDYGSPTGFVAFQRYLQANQDDADKMAKRMAGQAVGTAATGAQGAYEQQRGAAMLGTAGGQQALLQKAYGKGAASPFDAALAGAQGGGYFTQLQQAYGHAGDQYAQKQQAQYAARKPAQQAKPTGYGDVMAQQQAQAAKLHEAAQKYRTEDAQRPRGQMGREQWANLHGMTLEQWIQNGEQPAF